MSICFHTAAQILPTGIPPIRNFSKKAFQAAPQNWDIARSDDQIMYFANNLGLLSFDGTFWQHIPIGNKTILRSICILQDGRIMAGGQGEFGFFETSKNGSLLFHSLVHLMPPAYRSFEDVWHIEYIGDRVFFNTSREVFIWDKKSIQAISFSGRIEKLSKIQNQLYLYEENGGLYKWNGKDFNKLTAAIPADSPVTGIISAPGYKKLLVSTMKSGLYYLTDNGWKKIESVWNDFFKENWINQIILLKDGNLVAGTAQNGILVFDLKGQNSLHLSASQGLQNNNVLKLFQDPTGDLWICTEHGIDLVQYHSPYRMLFPDGALRGAGYAAAMHQNDLYLGTTNGLFKFTSKKNIQNFGEIPGTKGQVWKLDTLSGKLFLGHHEGAFEVRPEGIRTILKGSGAWKFTEMGSNQFVVGTYEGVGLYKAIEKNYRGKILEGFEESSRIMVRDKENTVWMSHPYRGVFRLHIDTTSSQLDVEKMGPAQGLTTDLGNYIYKIHQDIYLSTENGLFKFAEGKNKFEKDSILSSRIQASSPIQLLYEDPSGNIWFHTAQETGYLEIQDQGLKKEIKRRTLPAMPEKLLGGFEFILALDERHYLFGAEAGFTLLDIESLKKDNAYQTHISAVYLASGSDSLIYQGAGSQTLRNQKNPLVLHPSQTAIRFNFSTSSFGEELREYRYQLEGLDESFSDWTGIPEIQFNNLSPGKYKFRVQSRVGGQIQSTEAQFVFVINSPWYQIKWVQGLGILLIASLIMLFFFRQRKKFESEKLELESIHQEQVEQKTQLVEKTAQEITLLKNEKLQAEIQHKNNELASTTMHLVQKQELLLGVENELKKLLKHKDYPVQLRSEIQAVTQLLQEDARIDEDWEKFSTYFDEVHGFFLQKLRERYPQLTSNDHKLCAYLRMNLSTKEIASLMNISVRGVEGSRYRLRKKLDLEENANLHEFMQQISS